MELGYKALILKPLVYGLVHDNEAAALVMDLSTGHTGLERFQSLFSNILSRYGGVDLENFSRDGSDKTLWKEMEDVQRERNNVCHRGDDASLDQAILAIDVGAAILQILFPKVLSRLGLYIRESGEICDVQVDTSVKAAKPLLFLKS